MTDMAPGHPDTGLVWFTSSHSSSEGGECVEVALEWRTSSHSSSEGGDCVEVALGSHTIRVRDTKDRDGAQLALAPGAWSAFVGYTAESVGASD